MFFCLTSKSSFSQIILKVYLDSTHEKTAEVPITPSTTCCDVIECCREPGEEGCHIAELWRGCERPIDDEEKPYEILQQWGMHRDEVKFYLRHQPALSPTSEEGRRGGEKRKNGMKEEESTNMLPSGVDLTLSDLQEMATRQQQQIEAQQEMLVAKEQRLKFLKQQELRHQQIASENERLRKVREKVEAQELKLKKLRALRGQSNDCKASNAILTTELESIKTLFNEKEKELTTAVGKVEELSRQLEELRNGHLGKINGCTALNSSPAILELEKLRKELMIRNKLNEQQSSKLAAHREVLMQRNDEITRMDQRVAELQLRLRTKRANPAPTQPVPPEQTKTSGDGAASRTSRVLSANVAAVEPYLQRTVAKEPLVSNLEKAYNLSKQDPKYQTLPYGIKFSSLDGKKTESNVTDDKKASVKDSSEKNGRPYGPTPTTTTSGYYRPSVGSTFVLAPKVNQDNVSTSMSQTRPSASIGSSLSPRPFGTPYSVGVPSVKSSTGNSTSPASSPSIVYTKQSSPSAGYQKTSTPVTSAVTNSTSATLREIFIMGGPNGPTSSENVTDSPPAGSQKPRPVTVTPTTIQGSPPRTTAAVNVKSAAYQLAISRPQPSAPAHRSVNLHSPTNSASSSTRPLSPTLRKNFSKPPSGAGVYGTRPVQPSTSGAGIAYEITSKTGTTSSQSAPQWTTNSVNVIPSSSSATSSSQMSPRRTPPVSNTQPFTNQPGRLAAKLKSAFFEEASIASGVPNTSIELRTNGSELRSTDSETNLPETRSNEAKQRYPEARQNGPDMKQSAPIGRQTDARQSGPQMTQSVPEVKQNEAIQRSSEQRQKGPEIKKHVAESRPVPSSIVATRATSSEQRVTVPEQKSKAMETRLGDMDVKSTAVNARQSSGVDTRPTTAVNTRQSSRVDTRPTTAVNTRQSSGVDMRPTTAVNARQSSGVDTRPTTTVSTPGIMRPNAAADPRAVAVSKPGSVDSRPSMTNSRTDSRPNITTINDTKSGIEAIVDQTSKSSETDLRASKPEDTTDSKDPKVDTSPNSVSSALSVLMAAPATTAASKPTYRYAPKSVIANTYMRKLGTDALEQYRKNMSQLYKDFLPGDGMPEAASQEQTTNDGAPPNLMAPPGSPQRIAGSHPPGSPQRLSGSRPPGSPQRLSGSHPPNGMVDRFGDDSPPFAGGIPNHPEHERLRYRPNAPRPLRRRLSNSEHDEYPKQIQRANQRLFSGSRPPVHPSTERNNKVNIASTKATGPPPDIIRVDHLQDSYNSNYSIDNVEQKAEVHYGPELDNNIPFADEGGKAVSPVKETHLPMALRFKKTNLKSKDSARSSRRVSFDPLALMLDASLEGELDLVKRTARQVPDPSLPNDEGITALHNAICAGHFEIVKFLVEYGCNVNAPDSDGWTPLHCAASCNNLPMVKLLVEHGACIFATTISDQETAAEKCEEDEDGYDGCSEYLYSIQEKLGILNNGVVYGVFDYQAHNTDELSFRDGNAICILRKGDEKEKEWWWSRINNKEGYIPRNLIGLHPRVFPQWKRSDLSSGEKT